MLFRSPKPLKPDLETALVKLPVALTNLTLRQALDAICKTTLVPPLDGKVQGLKYSVEDYAVVLSPKLPELGSLFPRTFKVDPDLFVQGLRSVVEPVPVPKDGRAISGGRPADSAGMTAPGGVTGTNATNELNRMLISLGADEVKLKNGGGKEVPGAAFT